MRTIWGAHVCTECGGVVDFYFEQNGGSLSDGVPADIICPKCGAENTIRRAMPCPACPGGWMPEGDILCDKCRQRLRGDLRLWLRNYSKAERSYIDELLDGVSVEEYV